MSTEKIIITRAAVNIFGITAAEYEKVLDQYYVHNDFFNEAESFSSLKTFFIGRTGIGKSAIINNIENKIRNLKHKDYKIIKINPEDFAFDIFERSELIKQLSNLGFNLSLMYKTIWQSIFVSEVLKIIYGNEKKGAIAKAFTLWGTESKAYKFLEKNNELEGDFSISEKVRRIISRMEHELELDLKLKDLGVGYKGKLAPEVTDQINKRIQSLEVAEIRYFISQFDSAILKDKKVFILIDDLDKNWFPNDISKKFIGSLFECIGQFANLECIKTVVSLRTNLFEQIELYQPEKYQQFIQEIDWSDEEIHRICKRRLNVLLQTQNDPGIYKRIFPKNIHLDSKKEMDFEEFLISRSNFRPRDAIVFINYILEEGIGRSSLKQTEVFQAEEKYSVDRLNALFHEWENPYSGIIFLKDYFSYTPHKLSRSDFYGVLENIYDFADKNKEESDFKQSWLLKYKYIDLEKAEVRGLLDFLYHIGLIGYKPSGGSKVRFSFIKGQRKITSQITDDLYFYINPCYYRSLNTSFY